MQMDCWIMQCYRSSRDLTTAYFLTLVGILIISIVIIPPPSTGAIVHSAEPCTGKKILFIAASRVLENRDSVLVEHLEALSYHVTVAGMLDATILDTVGQDLIIISESVESGALVIRQVLRDIPIPIFTWEGWLYDDFGMTGPTAETDYGERLNETVIHINNKNHPLASGLNGNVQTVENAGNRFQWGVPNQNAIIAATIQGEPHHAAIFAYEQGAAMFGLNAPARRVGMHNATGPNLTTEGWALFDAAVSWSINCIVETTPTPTTTGTTDAPIACAGQKILFVGSHRPLLERDQPLVDLLESFDYNVSVRDMKEAKIGDADGKELVIISESVESSEINTMFRDVPIPVVLWEGWLFDDMGMTQGKEGKDYGELLDETRIIVVNGSHPLAANLAGLVKTVENVGNKFHWGVPSNDATIIATTQNAGSRATIFAYEKGASLFGLNAPARRIGIHNATGSNLTPEGWALFEAAVSWAIGCSVNENPTATPTLTPELSQTPTTTATSIPSITATPTPITVSTGTATPSATVGIDSTPTPTASPTWTAAGGGNATSTSTATVQGELTPTSTATPSLLETNTATPTNTPMDGNPPTSTTTPISGSTQTSTPTSVTNGTVTATPSPTATSDGDGESTSTPMPSATATATTMGVPVSTSTPTVTPILSATATEMPTLTPTLTPSGTPMPEFTSTATSTPTVVSVEEPPRIIITKEDFLLFDLDLDQFVSGGDTLLYVIRIHNESSGTARNVTLIDTLDANTTLITGSVETTQGVVVEGNDDGNTDVAVDVGNLTGQDANVIITFQARVNNGVNTGEQVRNQAETSYAGAVGGSDTQFALLSDDPATTASNDPTLTPIGDPSAGATYSIYLPIIER